MTIFQPTRFDTLDSQAIAKGRQWSAQLATAIELAALRLRTKDAPLWATSWPIDTVPYASGHTHVVAATDGVFGWLRVVAPVPFFKPAICVRVEVALTFRASALFGVQVATRAKPFDPSLLPLAGDTTIGTNPDAIDASEIFEVPLLAGAEEELSIFVRATTGTQNLTMLGTAVVGLRQ